MNKKWIVSGAVVASLLGAYYFFGSYVQNGILPVSETVRHAYRVVADGFISWNEKYFMQAETISRLRTENAAMQKDALTYKVQLKDIGYRVAASNMFQNDANASIVVTPARTLSYSNLPNMYRIWIGFHPTVPLQQGVSQKVYGIIYPTQNKVDSVTCGIALQNGNGRYEAFLNGDQKCSYGVYIGKQKAPGVVYGRNQNRLTVKFIPTWMDVKVGDEVVTSGLDNIFFEGVKVGIVKSVSSDNAYKEAQVDGYYNPLSPNYFYLVEKAR